MGHAKNIFIIPFLLLRGILFVVASTLFIAGVDWFFFIYLRQLSGG